MIGALLYLRLTSLRNYVLFRLRRLRQPKYLIGAAVAVLYIYYFLLRRPGMSGMPGAAPGAADIGRGIAGVVCVAASALAVVRIAFAWIAPAEKPGLRFSEAEIAFLFPAPVTRRTLIHFRLLTAQIGIMFSSVLIVFFFRRFGNPGGSKWMHAVGWWVFLSAVDLHINGTNLTLSRLKEKGSGLMLWRMAAVAAIAAYSAAVVWAAAAYARASHLPNIPGGADIARLTHGLLDSSPLRWLVLPFTILFGPYFAAGIGEFALAMVPALLLLALHYYWVSRSEARFEEGSIALAEKRAAVRAAALRGDSPQLGASRPQARSGPFPLGPVGAPEIAFLWKNVLSMRSTLLTRRTVMLSLWIIFCLSFGLEPLLAQRARSGEAGAYELMIVMFCAIVAAYTLLMGPQVVRQDLRNDLPNMDILKTYPIEGWRLALGELLAPTAVLSLVLWACIIVCAFAIDPLGEVGWLTPGVRVTIVLCMGLATPLLCLIQLIVPNSVMVLLPGWYQASRSRAGGIELMGQRLILGVGQLLIALFVAAPAAGAGALIIFASFLVVGAGPAVALATVAVMGILAGEAAVGLWWLGAAFGSFDVSTESK
jgi:hypothetical protein